MSKDYVDLKIDTVRHAGGKELEKKLTGGASVGHPWSVILKSDGSQLITSDGPGGNIGCPVSAEEQAHFVDMIKTSRLAIQDKELEVIASELAAFAKSIGR